MDCPGLASLTLYMLLLKDHDLSPYYDLGGKKIYNVLKHLIMCLLQNLEL